MAFTALTSSLATGAIAVLTMGALGEAGAPPSAAPPREPGAAQAPAMAPAPAGEVLVRFRASADAGERAGARRAARAEFQQSLPVRGLQLVDPKPGVSTGEAIARLERSDEVLYAEPDVTRQSAATPNDPLFGFQWGLHSTGQTVGGTTGTPDADIDAPEAWDATTGSAGVTVAVVDSGVAYDHPDLAPNAWRNPGETGDGLDANGLDDDANGLVDDSRGWDWVDGDNSPQDQNGHGTHVAGTAAARGNDDEGVTGVAWNAGVLPLRVLDADGSGRVSDVISAYSYASRKQIRVVNASLGGGSYSRSERDAIAAAPNTLFVVAAGNDAADNDATGSYPCNYSLPNVICVAASDRNDALASFSNYGVENVDLAAPGVDIASTWLNGEWRLLDGTSMATPMVSGAAALVWSREPTASVAAVREALLRNTDPVPALSSRTTTGGRLNAYRAVTGASAEVARAVPEPVALQPEPAAPTPAPDAPPPAPPSDTTAPSLGVSVSSSQRISRLLERGLRPRVTCGEGCSRRQDLVIGRATVKRLRLGTGSRERVIGTVRSAIAPAGARTLIVRITSPRVRSALRRSLSVPTLLRTSATDATGNTRRSSRKITLKR